jgi:hypothetical protein
MYKAVDGVVTELFIYSKSKRDYIVLESKYSPYNEMNLSSDCTDYNDENASGGYRRFHLALNKLMHVRDILHINERDITCFKFVNKWVNGGRRIEETIQVGGRIKL